MIMPQLDTQYYATQIFWLVLFFTALYVFNVTIFLPFLRSKQRARSAVISHNLKMAETLLGESKKVKQDIEDMLVRANHDSHNIRMEAAKKAQGIVEKQLELSHKMFRDYLVKAEQNKQKEIYRIETHLLEVVEEIKSDVINALIYSTKCDDRNTRKKM